MDAPSVMLWLGMGLIAAFTSFAILWFLGRLMPQPAQATTQTPPHGREASYLFQDDLMFDYDAGILPEGTGSALSWPELREWFSQRFPGLPDSLSDLAEHTSLLAYPRDADDTAQLRLIRTTHGTRVTLSDPPHACPAERHAMLAAKTRMTEITEAFEAAPHPVWKAGPDGTIFWRNAACRAAFDPATQIFDGAPPAPGESRTSRFSIPAEDDRPSHWFELITTAHHWGTLHYASDITKVVSAERMRRDFVQTLTKTFAYLTIGLAVFDRNRKLALFNPALIDLTSLGADFLSGQPDLLGFFDKLRDRRVMPEPRSYASWRTQISEVIESAEGGLYQETWSLPNDVTYRVTGRPYPDGAIAFLFEDISVEVMLARRFRTELDLRQAALDNLPEAVIVIRANNVLTFCNTAATALLGINPDISFADMTVSDLMRACEAALPAPAVWREVADGLRQRQQSTPLRLTARLAPGQNLTCQLEMLPGGARMLILRQQLDSRSTDTVQLAAS